MKKICALPGCGREFAATKLTQRYCPTRNCADLAREMKRQEYRKEVYKDLRRQERAAEDRKKRAEESKMQDAIEEARVRQIRRKGLLIGRSRMESRDEVDL
jgi:hypothetical protein